MTADQPTPGPAAGSEPPPAADPVERITQSELRRRALAYHEMPEPGKIQVVPSKVVDAASDLALAYTPGVAAPCREIERNPVDAYRYTSKGNLVGVITDGSAVLGLGNIGPLAAKPVMEGKAMLFKQFAGIDVFDIEVNATSKEHFIATVLAIADTFGAINLEDIAAPDCFMISESLSAQLNIPVLHDDQSGTAVVACAALENALQIQDKRKCDIKVVCVGAGAAGIGILLLAREYFGFALEQIHLVDSKGLVTVDRPGLPNHKLPYAKPATADTSLAATIKDADVVIGVSQPNLIDAAMVRSMAPRPTVMAMANPDPEVLPSVVHAARPDAIVATGRSDFPNQVNNSVCFPYLFRGALDARAAKFTPRMLHTAVREVAALAREDVPREVRLACELGLEVEYGPEYILPQQNDPRLRDRIAPAVAQAYASADIQGQVR